jgi:hypothetical protein
VQENRAECVRGRLAEPAPQQIISERDSPDQSPIRASVRDSIIEAFLPADGSPGISFLRVEASPARPDDGIPASWLSIQVSRDRGYTTMSAPFDSPHVTAIAQDAAVGVLREKRKKRQAKLMPTVLIVDLSGNDLPDLRRRPETFGALWEPDDEFLAVGGVTVSTRSREPELRFSPKPVHRATNAATLRRAGFGVWRVHRPGRAGQGNTAARRNT